MSCVIRWQGHTVREILACGWDFGTAEKFGNDKLRREDRKTMELLWESRGRCLVCKRIEAVQFVFIIILIGWIARERIG